MRALGLASLVKIPRQFRRRRRVVNHDHPCAEARLQCVEHDAHIRVIAQAQEHKLRAEGRSRRVLRHFPLVRLLPRRALGAGPVPHADLVSGPGQMPRHVKSHHAKSKECRTRHL